MIEGAESVAKGSSHDLAGVSAIDSRVLEVRLKAPTSNFLMRLAEPYAVVLNPENVEDWATDFGALRSAYLRSAAGFFFDTLPVSSRPFRLAEYDFLGDSVVIERNPFFAHGPVELGGVRFVFNLPRPEPELRDDGVTVFDSKALTRIRLQGIEPGNIDAFHSLSDPENTHELTRAPADAVSSPLKLVSVFLALNSGAPPYDNSELRRLLAAASPTDLIAAVNGDPVATVLRRSIS